MPLVDVRALSKSYFTGHIETRALRNISFRIEQGEYVAIQGPSGCGKSTLLSIIGLLDVSTSGTYLFDGVDVERLGSRKRSEVRCRDIGVIFQNFNLIGDLTIYENVELPLIYAGMTRNARHDRIAEVFQRLKIFNRERHYPRELSGGEQQRVAVARALVHDPKLLLADEPTGNLDSDNGAAVMALLRELNSAGSTVVIVTHDPQFSQHATRAISLLDGRLADKPSTALLGSS